MFPVVPVDPSRALNPEYLGTKRKFWYADDESKRPLLFKAEERGTGEDWAEKVACELATLLGIPHVHYELAWDLDTEKYGVVCERLTTDHASLVHGNQLLVALDETYPQDQPNYKAKAHTVQAVAHIVEILRPPPPEWMTNAPPGIQTALGVFAGYTMLDAWIANQDRHHQNWGAIWDGNLHLAPTFDHGAALARNLRDAEREERRTTRDAQRRIPAFARRATSAFYHNDAKLSTLAAWKAFAEYAPDEARIWRERLEQVQEAQVKAVLDQVPPHRMTAICRAFTLNLLSENRSRILEADTT